ncbi:cytochrome C oxidase subunit IV family protein [Streptomyces sp. CA-100214]
MTLSTLFKTRSTLVWLLLFAFTFLSWALGAEHAVGSAVAVLVLALAMIKVIFVGLYFMEAREAPAKLRNGYVAYCLLLWAVLAGMYLWL